MTEIINTCSAAISLARELEKGSAEFYKDLAERTADNKDLFLSFAEENEKYLKQIERAYYGVITDALEGCFAFNINPEEYSFKTELAEKASRAEALDKAIEIEEKIIKFYSDAAEQSKSLMADVPRAFKMVAKKKANRQSRLKSILGEKG
jgi:rubrerythrin